MSDTPDVRPVGDLPDAIGKTAARELSNHGITHLSQVAARTPAQLLAIHGVGPKAIQILGETLRERGIHDRWNGDQTLVGDPGRRGFGTVTPYLLAVEPDALVAFLTAALDAEVTYRTVGGSGGEHIEVQIGDSRVMIGGGEPVEHDQPAALFLYVGDVDRVYDRAIRAGATSLMPPADARFGEQRGAGVIDPAGNQWFLGHHGPGSDTPG